MNDLFLLGLVIAIGINLIVIYFEQRTLEKEIKEMESRWKKNCLTGVIRRK